MRKPGRLGMVCLVIVFSVAAGAGHVLASGFGVFTHGAYALGQANAVTAHNFMPSAVFFNPALINDLPGTQAEFGATLLYPQKEFTSDLTGKSTDDVAHTYVPVTLYLTQALSDQFTMGVGLFSPFGLGTEWPKDWEGRYLATKSEMTTFNLNPVISWRITPKVSLAAGVAFLWMDATLENKLNLSLYGLADGNQKFNGDGQGIGYNFGLLAKFTPRLSLGISYRSEIDVDADGKVKTDLPAGAGFLAGAFPKTSASSTVNLPRQISAGLSFQASDRVMVELGLRWEEWSVFEELRIDLDQPIAGQTAKITPRDWNNTWAVNIGGQFRLNDTYSLLAGYLYETDPVPDKTFEPVIPDAESHLFTVGLDAQYRQVHLAVSYGLQLKEDRSKHNTISAPDGSTANGTYKSRIHLAMVSVSYRF